MAENMPEALKNLYASMVESVSIANITGSSILQSQLGGALSGKPSASGLPMAKNRLNSEDD